MSKLVHQRSSLAADARARRSIGRGRSAFARLAVILVNRSAGAIASAPAPRASAPPMADSTALSQIVQKLDQTPNDLPAVSVMKL